jgi:hypothetical protein
MSIFETLSGSQPPFIKTLSESHIGSYGDSSERNLPTRDWKLFFIRAPLQFGYEAPQPRSTIKGRVKDFSDGQHRASSRQPGSLRLSSIAKTRFLMEICLSAVCLGPAQSLSHSWVLFAMKGAAEVALPATGGRQQKTHAVDLFANRR